MTLEACFAHLSPDYNWKEEALSWPPDAFALCASALKLSGAYIRAATQWPPAPGNFSGPDDWVPYVKRIGAVWRNKFGSKDEIPPELGKWWATITDNHNASL